MSSPTPKSSLQRSGDCFSFCAKRSSGRSSNSSTSSGSASSSGSMGGGSSGELLLVCFLPVGLSPVGLSSFKARTPSKSKLHPKPRAHLSLSHGLLAQGKWFVLKWMVSVVDYVLNVIIGRKETGKFVIFGFLGSCHQSKNGTRARRYVPLPSFRLLCYDSRLHFRSPILPPPINRLLS